MRLNFELNVTLDDAEPYTVVTDQRDVAKFEIQDFGYPVDQLEDADRPKMVFFRYIGWSAAQRRGLTELTWLDFDRVCAEVMPVDDGEDGDGADDAEDPGRPDPSGTPTSPSPARRVKASANS